MKEGGAGTFHHTRDVVPIDNQTVIRANRDTLYCARGTHQARGVAPGYDMFGPRGKVDPERHLIGTATGWGGNAPKDALYVTVVPAKNDGKTVHGIAVPKDVPVDGFWSVSVYGAEDHEASQLPNAHIYAYTVARETETWGAPPARSRYLRRRSSITARIPRIRARQITR